MERPTFTMSLTRIVLCCIGSGMFVVFALMAYPGGSNPPDALRWVFWVGAVLSAACAIYMEAMHGTVRSLFRPPRPASEFRTKAETLSRAAHAIADRLAEHDGPPSQQTFGRDTARKLRGALAAYDHAVFEGRDRAAAEAALRPVRDLIHSTGQAAVKGEMGFDFGDHSRTFHDLETLFREARYRDEDLD